MGVAHIRAAGDISRTTGPRTPLDRMALAALPVSGVDQLAAVGLRTLHDRPERHLDLRQESGSFRHHHADCHACGVQHRFEIPRRVVRRHSTNAPIPFVLVMALCGLAVALARIVATRGRLAHRADAATGSIVTVGPHSGWAAGYRTDPVTR